MGTAVAVQPGAEAHQHIDFGPHQVVAGLAGIGDHDPAARPEGAASRSSTAGGSRPSRPSQTTSATAMPWPIARAVSRAICRSRSAH